ncbi:Ger(x)C family spore germination protein [Paenibacillus sp. sgz302251]|uniref:Ger(x)C family spore germination protein n=1 Tax=Paenibacillus sp. sgz302251 TaxID=3414493 RepID=UPI003C7CA1FE
MKAVRKIIAIGTTLSMLLLLPACLPFVENKTVEELAPVIFWSLDQTDEGQFTISTIVPPLIKEKKHLLSQNVSMIKQGGNNFNLVYNRELKMGQLRMLFINKKLAKKGIGELLSSMIVDPDISHHLYLAIAEGDLNSYLAAQINKQENLDYYLYRMFKHYEKNNQGELTIINLHHYLKDLHAPLANPILPSFKASKDKFEYEGTSLFNKDKLVTTVKQKDEKLLQLINNNHYVKYFPIPEHHVTIGHMRAKVHKKLNKNFSELTIKLKLTGRLEEYRGNKNIYEQKQFEAHVKELENFMENQIAALFAKLQQWDVDPFHIGELTISPWAKPISKAEWQIIWSRMKVKVDCSIELTPLINVKM